MQLVFHPAHLPLAVRSLEARIIGFDADWLRARWKIMGAGSLVVPPFAGKGRADGLWQTTCFELFLQPGEGRSTPRSTCPRRNAGTSMTSRAEGRA
ncbi:DOMON domain-containing protein [Novosphingobium panipatense]|uniref:hypothetical protein n=1 Tax=Novosphingobium panipatense TaxID=428991 RepID=UPI003606DC93